MRRRSFLAAMLAAGVAPAVVGSGVLMPVRKLILPGDPEWSVALERLDDGLVIAVDQYRGVRTSVDIMGALSGRVFTVNFATPVLLAAGDLIHIKTSFRADGRFEQEAFRVCEHDASISKIILTRKQQP